MDDLPCEVWVIPVVDASREALTAPSLSRCRGLPSSSSFNVDNGVRAWTEATPPPPRPVPLEREGGWEQAHHIGTAAVRRDDARTALPTTLQQPISETVSVAPPSDSLPGKKYFAPNRT